MIIENYSAFFWVCAGMAFFISAIVFGMGEGYDRACALAAFGCACHARAEIKILQTRIEALERE